MTFTTVALDGNIEFKVTGSGRKYRVQGASSQRGPEHGVLF